VDALVFIYLRSHHRDGPIEYASYREPGDHAFVVVGRPFASNPGNPSTCGSDCVIADGWNNCVVPASQYYDDMWSPVHAPRIGFRWPITIDPMQSTPGLRVNQLPMNIG
jgi:hypothetical protein